MKRFLTAALALICIFALFACSESESEAPDGQKTAGRAAGNEAVNYSFFYPEKWEVAENTGVVMLKFNCSSASGIYEYATMSVLTFNLADSSQGARDYWNGYEKDIQKAYSGYEKIDDKEIKLGGTVALKIKYFLSKDDGRFEFEQVVCCRNGSVYIVTLGAPEKYYEAVNADFGIMLDSFVFE